MSHEEYTDKLLYESPAISLSKISSILLGYGWEELQEAGRWRTPEDPAKRGMVVEKAKKAEGINLSSDPSPDHRPFIPPLRQRPASATRELRAVGTAFWELQQWIGIKFPRNSLGSFHNNNFPPKEFFQWVVEDNILKKLKEFGVSIPERAYRFVGFVEQEQAASQQKARPAAPGTRRAKLITLHFEALKIIEKLHKKGKPYTYRDISCGSDWSEALRVSGLSREEQPSETTIKKYLTEFRKTI